MAGLALALAGLLLAGCGSESARPAPEGWDAEFLASLNTVRGSEYLHPLTRCVALDRVAESQVAAIAALGAVAHRDEAGRTLAERATAAGYQDWEVIGENAAQRLDTAPDVIAAWKASEEHRLVLQNGAYRDVGIARVDGPAAEGYPYWVAVFGRGGSCT